MFVPVSVLMRPVGLRISRRGLFVNDDRPGALKFIVTENGCGLRAAGEPASPEFKACVSESALNVSRSHSWRLMLDIFCGDFIIV